MTFLAVGGVEDWKWRSRARHTMQNCMGVFEEIEVRMIEIDLITELKVETLSQPPSPPRRWNTDVPQIFFVVL
jgi:hypothetical protein